MKPEAAEGDWNFTQAEVDALRHPQAQIAAATDGLVPSILDKVFKGEL